MCIELNSPPGQFLHADDRAERLPDAVDRHPFPDYGLPFDEMGLLRVEAYDTSTLIEWVPPALDNYDAISAVYSPADPIDETPTGQSIDAQPYASGG